MERITQAVAEFIKSESDRKAKEYPIRVFLRGEEISLDDQWIENEEVHVSIEDPLFFAKTGKKGYVTMEMPKRMAD